MLHSLIIWFLAPVLVGAVIGGSVGYGIGAIVDLVIEYFRHVKHLNRRSAKQDELSTIVGKKIDKGDFNEVDLDLNEIKIAFDCGDKNTWDVRTVVYNEKADSYRSVTKIDFETIDSSFEQELLKDSCVIL